MIPPAEKRPSIVTLACALLVAAAAILAIRSLLPLPYLGDAADAARAAYANSTDPNLTGDRFATVIRLTLIGSTVLSVIVAAGLAVLALFDLRGNNVARILSWIFAGLGVFCCGLGSIAGNATSSLTRNNNSGVDTKAAAQQIADAYPSWYQPTTVVLTVLMVLALLAVIILLLLPAANAYFRRGSATRPQVVEPPYPTLPG